MKRSWECAKIGIEYFKISDEAYGQALEELAILFYDYICQLPEYQAAVSELTALNEQKRTERVG